MFIPGKPFYGSRYFSLPNVSGNKRSHREMFFGVMQFCLSAGDNFPTSEHYCTGAGELCAAVGKYFFRTVQLSLIDGAHIPDRGK